MNLSNGIQLFPLDNVKSLVYANKPATIKALKDNIVSVIQDILSIMLEKWPIIGRPQCVMSKSHMAESNFKCQCHVLIFQIKIMSD